MIDPKTLLAALQKRVLLLEDDLRARCNAQPEVDAPLRKDYEAAREKGRTALTYPAWRDEELTQIAVAWILAGVFVRFLEDNELIDVPFLAGGNAARHQRAQDEHSLFFRQHPTASERDYFEHVFNSVGKLPGLKDFFDRRHNPLWRVGPTADAAKALLEFWRKTDPDTGRIVHNFTDAEWNTRFLGDLYQDLSEAARKKFALLQTPGFIEEFILDHTLTLAINAFGYQAVRMIDPTCGSGHFCLGAFDRLFRLWQRENPGANPRVLAQRALDGVYGVDLNPYAVAIAGFRLLLAALRVSGIHKLKDAPDFKIQVTAGDSLLHGARFDKQGEAHLGSRQRTFDTEEVFRDELKHHYEVEDVEALHRILGQQYHAVVGNPPYITVKDRAVSELYRARFPSCHRQYSLSVPFMERFFDLAVKGDGTPQQPAGFVGQITASSFMKREFGKKLIEEYISRWDLTHILDTAGAYIPGHGTPTVILFGKNQPPVSGTIRTVLGIRGEPIAPTEPAQGSVWQAIVRQIDQAGSVSEWVSASDSPRGNFHRHPWSIGGGGAAELKDLIDEASTSELNDRALEIGFFQDTHADEAFVQPTMFFARRSIAEAARAHVRGEDTRDWQAAATDSILFPFDRNLDLWSEIPRQPKWAWLHGLRTVLWSRASFQGGTYRDNGRPWFDFHQFPKNRARAPKLIVFSEIGTHNHAALDRGGRVFNRTAPVIQLRPDATDEEHIRLLGILNSSLGCFYLKQVCHDKGGGGIGRGLATEKWEHFFAFNGTKLTSFPIPARQPTQLPTALVQTSTALQGQSPAATLASWGGPESGDLRPWLARARDLATRQRRQLIAWQEELDWQIYEAFGLVENGEAASPRAPTAGPAAVSLPEGAAVDAIPPEGLELGQRTFEIVLARKLAAGEAQSTWFELHGSTPITEVPRHWPAAYRELVERRIARIAEDPAIRLIEQPEYKRRWNTEPWDEQFTQAARDWLLARLEGYFFEGQRVCELKDRFSAAAHGFPGASQPVLVSTNQLATVVEADTTFLCVAEVYSGGPGFSVSKLVRELVEAESVPFLPFQRYKDTGLRKRQDWEEVRDLQCREDAIDAAEKVDEPGLKDVERLARKQRADARKKKELGDIPVPPKYGSGDFKKSHWWRLRGKLDVPKERWVIYPGAEREGDASPVIAWAGWDHAQQAQALAAYYVDASQNQGWAPERLQPLLAGLADLLPWLKQWHNTFNPDFSSGLGDYFAGFLDEEARKQGTTIQALDQIRLGAANAV